MDAIRVRIILVVYSILLSLLLVADAALADHLLCAIGLPCLCDHATVKRLPRTIKSVASGSFPPSFHNSKEVSTSIEYLAHPSFYLNQRI